ncbi:hypothetical protein EJD98_04185 [Mycolicibacterium peregrinum]|uniref:Uncharacterized protein n=1 Tax=Mycolicibacterium peregrinum TaxID=43304 RepID=A0A4Z0HWD4_MYCPR|nr:hypothetical protein EJD94_08315 [Mycolicibacterium peregrinum]TGB47067.1 hypothetical protein EJD98_04185 [Mycolicibacterium peregrinum]
MLTATAEQRTRRGGHPAGSATMNQIQLGKLKLNDGIDQNKVTLEGNRQSVDDFVRPRELEVVNHDGHVPARIDGHECGKGRVPVSGIRFGDVRCADGVTDSGPTTAFDSTASFEMSLDSSRAWFVSSPSGPEITRAGTTFGPCRLKPGASPSRTMICRSSGCGGATAPPSLATMSTTGRCGPYRATTDVAIRIAAADSRCDGFDGTNSVSLPRTGGRKSATVLGANSCPV